MQLFRIAYFFFSFFALPIDRHRHRQQVLVLVSISVQLSMLFTLRANKAINSCSIQKKQITLQSSAICIQQVAKILKPKGWHILPLQIGQTISILFALTSFSTIHNSFEKDCYLVSTVHLLTLRKIWVRHIAPRLRVCNVKLYTWRLDSYSQFDSWLTGYLNCACARSSPAANYMGIPVCLPSPLPLGLPAKTFLTCF